MVFAGAAVSIQFSEQHVNSREPRWTRLTAQQRRRNTDNRMWIRHPETRQIAALAA